MQNPSGTLVINGINDSELVKILEIKTKHKNLVFNPQQLQPLPNAQPQTQEQHYNGANFNWHDEKGLEALRDIIAMLLKKEHHEEKAA